MVWLCVCSFFIFSFVYESRAQSCNPFIVQGCPYQEVLVDRMQLVPAQYFKEQCRKNTDLFKCLYKYGGSCDVRTRIKWEPHQYQTNFICGVGKTAYLNHADCWTTSTSMKLVDCNRDFKTNSYDDPCVAFTKYVSCAEASVIGVCRIGAEEVMKNMTEMYVFPMRRALQCPVDQLGVTTEVTSSGNNHAENVVITQDSLTTVASTQNGSANMSSVDVTTFITSQDIMVLTDAVRYNNAANTKHQKLSTLSMILVTSTHTLLLIVCCNPAEY